MGPKVLARFVLPGLVFAAAILIGCQPDTPDAQAMQGATATPVQAAATQASTSEAAIPATPTPTPTVLPTATPLASASGYDLAALDMIALINEWRITEGLAPFSLNGTLFAMAADQADYLLSLPSIPDGADIHVGRTGESSPERGLMFGWPHYATELQTAIGEVACARADAADCIGFWHESSSHNRTLTNAGYREIGAAVWPISYGYLYIVVVGSRPGVLPALVDPVAGALYLTSEQFAFPGGGDWILGVTGYQILPSASSPPDPDGWQPYTVSTALPEEYDAGFAVAYTDGTYEVITQVQPTVDVVWTPSLIAALGPLPPAVAEVLPTATSTSIPTAVSHPTATPASATPVPTAQPTTAAGAADLALEYDALTLSITNVSGGPVDLSQLEVVGGDHRLPATMWLGEWLANLEDFPAGHCLHVWSYAILDPGAPAQCSLRRASIYRMPDSLFWAAADFEVRWADGLLRTCPAGGGRCEVDLPGD